MIDFIHQIAAFEFLQYAVIALLLCSIPSGTIGSIVVVRKSTYAAGAIAHAVIGGLGLSHYLRYALGWHWFSPDVGAILSSLLIGTVLTHFTCREGERIDTVLSLVWALGMALGLFFFAMTPGFGEGIMSYLFGDVLLVGLGDLVFILILNVTVLLVLALYHRGILAVGFHAELARMRGLSTWWHEWILMQLIGLTVLVLIKAVGILLVVAMMTLPAATAAHFCKRLSPVFWMASLIALAGSMIGLYFSFTFSAPAGPTIILVYSTLFVLSFFIHRIRPIAR